MAKKNVDAKLKVTDVPLQDGVDAEVAYSLAENANADKQWLEETSKVWANRQDAEKQQESSKAKGDAVVNVADAAGAVGENSGASIILADESKKDEAAPVVKKKDDDSDDKAGYIWGGLGLLGLVGIALAAGGGGGGGGGSSSAPLNLDGLVIDDPVANAIVFRDVFGDGRLHVIEVTDGRYIVHPDQAITVTDDEGKFASLGGSGRIISVGINRLPLLVHDEGIEIGFDDEDPALVTGQEGDQLFRNVSDEDLDRNPINDGELAYIVGENQIFESLVISSGITLDVRGADVTLVTGVTALVDAYLTRYEDEDFVPTESQIKTAIYEVAALFGYQLDADSSDENLMSFLLGGYDVDGIDSPDNLNQEIYSVVNSVYAAVDAITDFGVGEDLPEFSVVFESVLNAILLVQSERVTNDDENLATFATDQDIVADIVNEFIEIFNQAPDTNDISLNDAQLLVDVALNHANFGGGAADIYETDEDGYNFYGSTDLVNMVEDGDQLFEDEVERVGNITVLAEGNGDSVDLYLGEESDPVELMGSNILVQAYGDDSLAVSQIYAENATGSEMSNGTYTYDDESDELVPLGDINVQAVGEDSVAILGLSGDLLIDGDVSVVASGEDTVFGEDTLAAAQIIAIGDDGFASSMVAEVNMYDVLWDGNTNTNSVFILEIDGKKLSAQISEDVTDDSFSRIVASIASQWSADPDYASLPANTIEYWGSYVRISFEDTASHDVDADRFNGFVRTGIDVYEVQDNNLRESEINFDGSHLEVMSTNDVYDDESTFDINAALYVAGATGTIDGIDVISDGTFYTDSNDHSETLAFVNLDGTVSGEINVKTLEDSDRKLSALSLSASAGGLELDDVTINVIADGYESSADLDVGYSNGSSFFGYDHYDDEARVTGSVNGITVSALGYDNIASADIKGDIEIGGTVLIETEAQNAFASLDLESYYDGDNVYASSMMVYDNVDIIVRAYGDDSYALLDADDTNASGSINSVTVIADADAALDGTLNAESANAEIWDLTLNGTLGNVTVKALSDYDYADLEMDSSSNRSWGVTTQVFSIDVMNEGNHWNSLQSGDLVSLTIGDVVLTATVNQNVNDDYGVGIEVLADVISQFQALVDARNADENLSDLNVVFKQTGNLSLFDENSGPWYGQDGIWVRWLEAGEQEIATLSVDGEVFDPTDYRIGNDVSTSIEFLDSVVTASAIGNSSDAEIDIADGTGRIDQLIVEALGDWSDTEVDIELGGLLGNVTITAEGEDVTADVNFESMPEPLVYDDSVISVNLSGADGRALFHQDGYATGTIHSFSTTAIGEESAYLDVILGGDITFDSEINISSISTSTASEDTVGTWFHLANENNSGGMHSTFHMDEVDITVESVGYGAYSELTTQNYAHDGFSSDSSIDSIITGTINELNVYAGVYDPLNPSIDPTNVASAESYVDLNVHGVINSINIDADHVSRVDLDLFGDINANGVMDVEIANTNSSYVDLNLFDVSGDISNITVTSDEGAETWVEVETSGSIGTVDLTTDTDAFTYASFDISGAGNYIENLTIETIGTDYNDQYTTVADVVISQEAHGGIVNIINGPDNHWADTRLTYNSNFQADVINIAQAPTTYDGDRDLFGLQINMEDVDDFDVVHQTILRANMTTVNGLTDGLTNPVNNYIQFSDLDDSDYGYDLSDVDNATDGLLGISHYSDGLEGWRGGDSLDLNDDFEGSSLANYEANGFYGSFNSFFDAAQYGIASEYAFVDLNQFAAAGYSDEINIFDTDIELTIQFRDAGGALRTVILNQDLGNVDLNGSLLGEGVSVQSIINAFNADTEWDGNDLFTDNAWSNSYLENNVRLFDNGAGILGIRIGEGYFESVTFTSLYDDVETVFNYSGDVDETAYDTLDTGRESKGYINNLSKYADFDGESTVSLDPNNPDTFDTNPVEFVEGGGYFFGMVLNDDGETYRGVLAMDEDGEGVTKLIELADVIADKDDVDLYMAGSWDISLDGSIGYDEFSSAYIAEVTGYVSESDGFDYDLTADNYPVYMDFIP